MLSTGRLRKSRARRSTTFHPSKTVAIKRRTLTNLKKRGLVMR